MRAAAAVLVVLLAACSGAASSAPPAPSAPAQPAVADTYALELVADGLEGPTQVVEGPDGRLWVAQLAGPEGAATGQVVAVDPATGAREVLVEGLAKPTGLAVLDDALWVMEEASLARLPLRGGRPGDLEIVQGPLPSNGRSEGTLTVTPDGALLYDTSGALRGGEPVYGSGVLWRLDPAEPATPRPLATGFKHAYAHVAAADGTVWTTEVNDGSFDGAAAPEEVVRLTPPADGGWPRCIGDREPVAEYGGTAEGCAATAAPVALLPPGSTPTGLAVAPWDAATLVTTRWTAGEVVAVPAVRGDGPPAQPRVVVRGLDGPQHLLATDGGLLLTEHGTGRIWRLTRPATDPAARR